eukprot:Nk52_evm34s228 gene=Nk52_evmTU34s228
MSGKAGVVSRPRGNKDPHAGMKVTRPKKRKRKDVVKKISVCAARRRAKFMIKEKEVQTVEECNANKDKSTTKDEKSEKEKGDEGKTLNPSPNKTKKGKGKGLVHREAYQRLNYLLQVGVFWETKIGQVWGDAGRGKEKEEEGEEEEGGGGGGAISGGCSRGVSWGRYGGHFPRKGVLNHGVYRERRKNEKRKGAKKKKREMERKEEEEERMCVMEGDSLEAEETREEEVVVPSYWSELPKFYGTLMRGVGHKLVLRLGSDVKRHLCRGCFQPLVEGLTARVRLVDPHKRRRRRRRWRGDKEGGAGGGVCKQVTCNGCGWWRRYGVWDGRYGLYENDKAHYEYVKDL